MPFGCIWDPFGCLLDAFSLHFGARDTIGVHFGEFVNFSDFWSVTGVKNSPQFDTILILLTTCCRLYFLSFFWLPCFLTFCGFGIHLGDHLVCFLEGPVTFKIELKRWREYDFHTLEFLFAGMISRLDLVVGFLSIFEIFDVLRTSILGVF